MGTVSAPKSGVSGVRRVIFNRSRARFSFVGKNRDGYRLEITRLTPLTPRRPTGDRELRARQ